MSFNFLMLFTKNFMTFKNAFKTVQNPNPFGSSVDVKKPKEAKDSVLNLSRKGQKSVAAVNLIQGCRLLPICRQTLPVAPFPVGFWHWENGKLLCRDLPGICSPPQKELMGGADSSGSATDKKTSGYWKLEPWAPVFLVAGTGSMFLMAKLGARCENY